jgi:hypothetical protein
MRRTFGKPAKRHNVPLTREEVALHAEQRKRKNTSTPERQWWAGVLTLLLIIAAAGVLAVGVQYGLELTHSDEARVLYYIFFTLSSPGILAGAMYESGGHGLIFDLRQTGQIVCMCVNGVIYGLLIFIWLKYHGDARLKK